MILLPRYSEESQTPKFKLAFPNVVGNSGAKFNIFRVRWPERVVMFEWVS